MGRLQDLYGEQGQSPWLDNLRRDWLASGEIQRWIDRGVRGITSNPSIFQKAIEHGDEYTEQLADLTRSGVSVLDAYWDLVTDDIAAALAQLRPLYDASDGGDGYVSVEVAPNLARDTDGTMTPEEIIGSVEHGIYAVSFGGGQVDITSGKFVFSASEAYWVENGKIQYPVKGATIIGSGPESLKKVTMIGNDMRLDSGVGTCGKEGQSVPVGVGQPTLRIEGLTVGGTA